MEVIDATHVPETIEEKVDALIVAVNTLGEQMNWLVENLQSMFVFVQQVGSNGGGLRGLMQAMKHAPTDTVVPDASVSQQIGEEQ